MNCCQCQGIELTFDDKLAREDLKTYREEGPEKGSKLLIQALKNEGVEGKSLLDIGGGIGAIQHELAAAGATRIVNVDASSSYLKAAQEEASRRGYVKNTSYHHGDFVDLAPQIEAADIVTLDGVICCYHDMESLVGLSADRARELYALIFPHDVWYLKAVRPFGSAYFWLRRNPYRFYLHPTREVDALLRQKGLERILTRRVSMIFQMIIYGR
jgi:magnesium-protoporphyrin O-methyltransferase